MIFVVLNPSLFYNWDINCPFFKSNEFLKAGVQMNRVVLEKLKDMVDLCKNRGVRRRSDKSQGDIIQSLKEFRTFSSRKTDTISLSPRSSRQDWRP